MKRILAAVLAICFLSVLAARANGNPKHNPKAPSLLPVTTSSTKARDLFQSAVRDYETLHLDRALIGWRAATKEDPQFAQAYLMLAMNSLDPNEVQAARQRAKELAAQVTPGEKLMIQWIASTQEGNYLAGIAAMNDLVAMFPRDKRVYFYAGNWLTHEQGNEQAHHFLHKALELDPEYAPALNDMAYLHAGDRNFKEALADMDRYVQLLPNEPNPQDSYAEILRMAGRFNEALEHYRAALKIDPHFNYSQLGLGDTYALMGDEEQARKEYDKAIAQEADPATRFEDRMQKAITWVREKNYPEADREFRQVATEAHAQSYELQEAEAFQRMAEYQVNGKVALKQLASAEDALKHSHSLSAEETGQELAHILRVRASCASRAGKQREANVALHRLEKMAAPSRSRLLQEIWHGAAGAALVARGKFQDAIPELEEDQDSPESLSLLARAYSATGAAEKSRQTEERLRGLNLPTLEQALAAGSPVVKAGGM